MDLLYLVLIAAIGSFIQTSSGIGYAILTMALWPIFIPFRQASAVELITGFIMVIYILFRLSGRINFRLLLFPLISSVLLSTCGVFTLMSGTEVFLRRILGIFLLILSAYFIFFNGKIRIRPTRINGLIAGGLSGFFGGMLGIGGPPIVIYLMSVTDDKIEFNATLQGYYIFSSISILILHLFMGNVTGGTLKYSAVVMLGVLAGTGAGISLFKKLSMDTVKKLVNVFMAVAGIYLIITG